jgi:L-lactate utilization protein LutC
MVEGFLMTTAREEILDRIRFGLAAARAEPGFQEPTPVAGNRVGVPVLPESIPLADTFSEALEAVGGIVHRCPRGEGEAILERVLQDLGAEKVARSDSPPKLGELLEADVGVSYAQWGIAETGTLILTSDEEKHRLVSLVPPVHVAILREENILPNLDEALGKVHHEEPDAMSRAITWITGPSRTADIELTLVVGVHGPRELHVILEASG